MSQNNNTMNAKPGVRVLFNDQIFRTGSIVVGVMSLNQKD